MHEVINHEEQDDETAPRHRAGCITEDEISVVALVTHGSRRAAAQRQLHGCNDVNEHGGEENEAYEPEQLTVAEKGLAKRAQPFRVMIESFPALIDLQVTEHVASDKPDEHNAGDRHGDLLADGRVPQGDNAAHLRLLRRAQLSSAIVSRTASADLPSAALSSFVSSTSS